MTYTRKTEIREVINDPVFKGKGRLLFPVHRGYMSGSTLGSLDLTWYSEIDPDMTVTICNSLKERTQRGEEIFFDICSEEEKKKDPQKNNTGLWYFKGKPGNRFAVCSAGGGFAYVGAMHDSFPHAYTLTQKGYHAFALIYRPGAQTACEDLARAIAFIFEHAEELQVNTDCYSLWGGSAGARMAAWLGSCGTVAFGEKAYPNAGTVVMQYTGLGEVFGNEPPTYNCVGTDDWIASYETMERRIDRIRRNGTDAMIEVFPGLGHGFGLGTNTAAERWFSNAVSFWERQMEK
ncbi:MAG: alpha/beta hydrolase [Solobacterium sp.]|nr:alpha/beta hydrolase [Solobacterium sp.]